MEKIKRDYGVAAVAISCALAALFTVLFLGTMPFNRDVVAKRDFITYWATGRQLLRHGNPYDSAALNKIELDAGLKGPAYFMRNVPWALPLAIPLGYFNAQTAALPWSLLMLALLIISVRMMWKMAQPLPDPTANHLEWLGYCFPPALFCVILGQTSILLLFGLVLFLRLHRTHPFGAGAALWLCSLKPHLFLPFIVVLLAWIVVSGSYRIVAGAAATMAASAAITEWIAPGAFGQYLYYARTSGMTHEFTACLGDVIRDAIHPAAEWLAFVPAALGCVWALGYFWAHREDWDWIEDGNLLVLVSLLVAPFGWIFDQSIAIPAILLGVARSLSRALLAALAGMYFLIEFEVNRFDLHSKAFLWAAPAWLIWYWLARRSVVRESAAVTA